MTDDAKMSELAAVTAKLRKIDKERDPLRERATQLVLDLLRAGTSPTEVVEASPYSAAYVRKLARDNDIPPAGPGIKPRRTSGK